MFAGPGTGSGFGSALAVGDFNHDATDDLAIGAPGLAVGGRAGAGGVAVFYGEDVSDPNSGEARPDLLTRSTTGFPGDPIADERFGAELASADFDNNGRAELAIVGRHDRSRLATIQIAERGPGGYTNPQPGLVTQQAAQGPGESRTEDDFGSALAAADFNADGRADLAVGAPGRGCSECDEEYGFGEVVVLPGSAAGGVTATGRQVWTQNSVGVPGTAQLSDGFGAALVAGDFDGDADGDLAIGAPEDIAYRGSVTVLVGRAGGLTATGGATFTQATPGIAGASGPHSFGGTLAAAHVQNGALLNLIIGAESQDIDGVDATGLINQLVSSEDGPLAAGSRTVHLDTAGVKGRPDRFAQFGFELS